MSVNTTPVVFTLAIIILATSLYAPATQAQTDLPQHFTLDGRLLEPGSATEPLLDNATVMTIQVLNPAKDCILYEEEQPVNTLGTNGYFSIRVGSNTSATKRTTLDSNNSMNTVFYNRTTAISGKDSGGGACNYTPSAGEERFFRFFVKPSSASVAEQLSDDMPINSVPQAIVAQTLQGYSPTNFFRTSVTSTQVKLDNLLTTEYNSITDLISGASPLYLPNDPAGTVFQSRNADPVAPTAGQVWYNSSDNKFKFYDGVSTVDVTSGAGSGTVTAITAGAGLAGGTINTTGTISIADGGVTTVKLDDASVTEVKIADGSISTSKLVDANVTNAKLATGIDAAKITVGTLPAGVVPTGTDDTKLPLAGGTMTGVITMGDETNFAGFDLLNTGHITMNGQKTITIGRYDAGQEATLIGTLSPVNAGALWFNTTTGKLMFWSGTQEYEISESTSAGGDITAVNTNTGSGLSGGSTSGPVTLAINVDGTSIEIATNTLRIADGGVSTAKLADASVSTSKLVDASVTEVKLADDSVSTSKLVDASVTEVKLADGSVSTSKLVDGAVGSSKLANDAITTGKILDGTIVDADISATAGIAWSKISKIGASASDLGAVPDTRLISTGAGSGLTGGGDLTADRSLSVNVDDLTVEVNGSNALQVKDLGISTSKLADASVTEVKLADGAVSTNKLVDGAVTSAKIANGTITSIDVDTISIGKISSAVTEYFSYMPAGTECNSGEILKWDATNDRWLCDTDAVGVSSHAALTDLGADDHTQYALLAGRAGGQNYRGGTGANDDLTLESTSNATKGFVLLQPTGGNVGVGTISPSNLIHVSGPTANYPGINITEQTGAKNLSLRWDNGGNMSEIVSSGASAFRIWTNGSERFRIDSVGNVGVGTASPAVRLHVSNGAGMGVMMLGDNTAGNNHHITHESSDNSFRIYDGVYGSGTTRLMINSTGNVGIGTSNPQALLDVAGIIRAQQICDEAGSNCKDLSSGWGAGGDIDGIDTDPGSGLAGGTASGTANLSVVVDATTIEVNGSNALQVKDLGIGTSKLADGAVTSAKIADGTIVNADINASAAISWSKIDKTGATAADVGAATSSRTIATNAGSGMSGGGDLTADRALSVNVDDVGVEISSNALRLKDGGVTTAKLADNSVSTNKLINASVTEAKLAAGAVTSTILADGSVTSAKIADGTIVSADVDNISIGKISSAAAEYFSYMPAGTECNTGEVLKWDATNDRWLCDTDAVGVSSHAALTDLGADDHTQYALLAGRTGGQNFLGGTNANNNLTLESTSNATKGYVLLQPNGGNVGIGTNVPASELDVAGTIRAQQVCDETGANCKDVSTGWGAGGDVSGPASATDNAIARFDGTTGKSIQNSALTLSDTGATVLTTSEATALALGPTGATSPSFRIQQGAAGGGLQVASSATGATLTPMSSGLPNTITIQSSGAAGVTELRHGGGNEVEVTATGVAVTGTKSTFMGGNVGIGTTNPLALLDVAGIVRAQQICDETGANCKDISTGWATGVATTRAINTNSGSGLTGGGDLSSDRNIAMNVDNTTIEIATNTVQVKDGGISTAKLAATSVTDVKIATSAVTTAKIADTAVTDVKLAANAVTTAKIADSAVTDVKLAASAVTTAKLADTAVTTAKLADNSVTSAKIVDGTIVSADVDNISIGKISSAAAEYFSYMPAGSECNTGEVLKWNATTDRWLCDTDLVGAGDHGALPGLGDDDHTQYALLAGRAGGQTLIGGTAASDNLTLESTSNAAKGNVLLQPNGGNVGIGTTTPTEKLEVLGNSTTVAQTIKVRNDGATGNSSAVFRASSGTGVDNYLYTFGTAGYVGTGSNHNLNVITNNAVRATFDSAGNVGIGTITPGYKLDVNGTINATGLRIAGNTLVETQAYSGLTTGTWYRVAQTNSTVSQPACSDFRVTWAGGSNGSAIVNACVTYSSGANTTGSINILSQSSDVATGVSLMRVVYDMNALANSSRAYLEVYDSNALNITVESLNASALTSLHKGWALMGATTAGSIPGGYTSRQVSLGQGGGISTTGNLLVSGGNVGIGTTSPSNLLHVASSGNAVARLESGAGLASAIYQYNGATAGGGIVMFPASDSRILSVVKSDLVNVNAPLTVLQNGNIGIGTTNPQAELDVHGSGTGMVTIRGPNTNNYAGIEFYKGASTRRWSTYLAESDDRFYMLDADHSHGVYLAQNVSGWSNYSDRRLKRNIKEYSVLEKLKDFRAVSYDWKMTNTHEVGVVAQEIYQSFPEVVDRGDDDDREIHSMEESGIWGVRYHMLAPIALQGVKELYGMCKKSDEDIRIMNSRLEQHGRDIASIKTENEKLKKENKEQTTKIEQLQKQNIEMNKRLERLEKLIGR